MKFLSVIIDLPRSAYSVSDCRQEIIRKLVRIVAVCLAELLFDLFLGRQKTFSVSRLLHFTSQNIIFAARRWPFTMQKIWYFTLQTIIYGLLPPIWAI